MDFGHWVRVVDHADALNFSPYALSGCSWSRQLVLLWILFLVCFILDTLGVHKEGSFVVQFISGISFECSGSFYACLNSCYSTTYYDLWRHGIFRRFYDCDYVVD